MTVKFHRKDLLHCLFGSQYTPFALTVDEIDNYWFRLETPGLSIEHLDYYGIVGSIYWQKVPKEKR